MIIMNTMEYKQQLLKLLSLEYNCDPDAFAGEDNILTESKLCDGRRMYGNKSISFIWLHWVQTLLLRQNPAYIRFYKNI